MKIEEIKIEHPAAVLEEPEVIDLSKETPILVGDNVRAEGLDENLQKCPKCEKKSLRVEGGCISCIDSSCGYGKCEV